MSQGKKAPLAERFWEHVEKGQPDECWLWVGSTNNCGYGTIGLGGARRMGLAHRVSWELHHGPIPSGMKVLHRCDRPRCVNPAHLVTGTQRENIDDCLRKGRWTDSRGEKHPNAKLTSEIVRQIRELAPVAPHKEIAARFGVSRDYVSRIARRKAWPHLPS